MTKKIGLFLLFVTMASLASAKPIIVHQPPLDARVNQPMVITATISDPGGIGINQVILFVRTKGTLGYWQGAMQPRGSVYTATIPKKLVLPAGVEYYIEVKDKTGASRTAPILNASITPYTINVIGDQGGPKLELLSPDDGAVVNPEEVVIVVAIDSGKQALDLSTLKFYFDEQDVTGQVNQNPNMLSYVASEQIAPGLHGIRVEVKDSSGRLGKSPTWSIRVKDKAGQVDLAARKKAMKWRGQVIAESQYSLLTTEPISTLSLRQPEGFLNRLKVNLNGEVEDWRFIGQVDMSSEETPGQQPVNRFQVEAYRPELSIKVGDIYPVFSEFSMENYFIRGGGIKLLSGQAQGAHSELSVVGGISKFPIEGRQFEYDYYIGTTLSTKVDIDSEGTFEQWVFGSRYDYEFLPGTGISLNLSSVNDFKNSVDVPAGAIGRINHVVTGEGKLKIFFMPTFTTSFYGEYGLDYFDEDQTVASISIGDAYRVGNRWEWQGNSFIQVEYRQIGANYVSLTNPWLITDWQGVITDAQLNFMNNNLSIISHVESWKDNVGGQKNIEYFDILSDPQGVTITARGTSSMVVQGSINYRHAPTLQSLFVQVAYNNQVDEDEPVHLVNTNALLMSFGSTLLFPIATTNQLIGSLSYTLNQINNEADVRLFGNSNSGTLNIGTQYLHGRRLMISAGFGFTQTDEDNDQVQLSTTTLASRHIDQSNFNLRGDLKLLPNQLDLFGNIDWLAQADDVDTLDETVMTMAVGSTLYLPNKQNLMLTLSNIAVDDQLNDDLDYSEFIIDLRYSIGF